MKHALYGDPIGEASLVILGADMVPYRYGSDREILIGRYDGHEISISEMHHRGAHFWYARIDGVSVGWPRTALPYSDPVEACEAIETALLARIARDAMSAKLAA